MREALVQAALVEVDINTGQVKVFKVITAYDVGRALNPLAVAGKIEGGVRNLLEFGLPDPAILRVHCGKKKAPSTESRGGLDLRMGVRKQVRKQACACTPLRPN